jgi:hypothetical protein
MGETHTVHTYAYTRTHMRDALGAGGQFSGGWLTGRAVYSIREEWRRTRTGREEGSRRWYSWIHLRLGDFQKHNGRWRGRHGVVIAIQVLQRHWLGQRIAYNTISTTISKHINTDDVVPEVCCRGTWQATEQQQSTHWNTQLGHNADVCCKLLWKRIQCVVRLNQGCKIWIVQHLTILVRNVDMAWVLDQKVWPVF